MDLIRFNVTDSARCKWITVTYAEVMTDGKQAFLDTEAKIQAYITCYLCSGISKDFVAEDNVYSEEYLGEQIVPEYTPSEIKEVHNYSR